MIISKYESVEPPELNRIAEYDDEVWWSYYTRATGIRKEDTGHFFAVMPTPDQQLDMRTLWVKDRFQEGFTRSQVIALVEGMK